MEFRKLKFFYRSRKDYFFSVKKPLYRGGILGELLEWSASLDDRHELFQKTGVFWSLGQQFFGVLLMFCCYYTVF